MAGNAGSGRKKGSKNKATVAKLAGKLADVAPSFESKKRAKRELVVAAKKGISPKDLLLHAMREAWESYHRLIEAAQDAKGEALALGPDHSAYPGLIDKVSTLKLAADAALELACDLAVKVAPYEHAKLANVDTRVRGNVVVKIAKF